MATLAGEPWVTEGFSLVQSVFKKALLAGFVSGLLISFCPIARSSNVFEDAWNVVADPLKLDHSSKTLSDSLYRTLLQVDTLESRANYDASQRIAQIRSILADADQDINKAEKEMAAIEAKVNQDAINLIYRSECALVIATLEFRQGMADILSDLRKSDPHVTVAGITIVDFKSNKFEINDPDKAYWDLKKKRLLLLENDVTDDSNAYEILSTYQNLERAAKFARCSYLDQALDLMFVSETNGLELLSLPWTTTVRVTHPN